MVNKILPSKYNMEIQWERVRRKRHVVQEGYSVLLLALAVVLRRSSNGVSLPRWSSNGSVLTAMCRCNARFGAAGAGDWLACAVVGAAGAGDCWLGPSIRGV